MTGFVFTPTERNWVLGKINDIRIISNYILLTEAYTHIYIYFSQHVDLSNINALCLGGGTRCSGRVSVPCFTNDTCHKL